ncbi:MAG TPA: trypsin-like peptidase domain-containing protein [Pyrinomonadaceae bacterium]|nr:trypsin-like peptidase domain-containing protein [Pyrinomonadaceae bacterium]
MKRKSSSVLICLLLGLTAFAQTPNTNRELDPLHQFNTAIRKLVRQVTPSVVQIQASGYEPVENNNGSSSLLLGMQQKIGSGVIVDASGYIVTNAHVVRGAQHVSVSVPAVSTNNSADEPTITRTRTLEARVLGADDDIDLAVLKVEATNLPAMRLSDYNKLRQGDVVFAFGSPDGLQDSVTMGVVSAVARQLDADSPLVFVQSDAPTNPGNSGGPLVNVDGELVGINTFILSQGGGNEGLGFAIPCAIVAYAYPQLRKYGHLHRGTTGIGVQSITPELAAGLKLDTDSGVIISDVEPESPAEAAGVKVGDIITSIDGYAINSLPALGTRLFMRSGGEQIKLGVRRGSSRMNFSVALIESPGDLDTVAALTQSEKSRVSQLGVIVMDIDPQVAAKLTGLRIASGVLVVARQVDSTADVSLEAGDIIHTLNGSPIKSVEALRTALNRAAANTPVVLQIERSGKLMFVAFKLSGPE